MTELEYREVKRNSSSSLKDFDTDRKKYYKRHILGEEVKEKPNKAADMGRMVETILMEPERFDELFYMSAGVKSPTGLTGDFIYNIAQEVSEQTKKKGVEPEELDFEEIAKKAYVKVGFKLKFESVLKKLDVPEYQLYYNELLEVMYHKKTLVDTQDVTNAENIVTALKENFVTSSIVNRKSNATFSVANQMKVIDFAIDGLNMKGMLDKVIINHAKKSIQIYDLKCTWNVENFYKDYYLYRKAYIQAYVYWTGLIELSKDTHPGYKVLNPQFIVCDSINYYNPLIYTLSDKDLQEAYEGFENKGYQYRGVKEIISNLQWAIKKDVWNISKNNYEQNGIINIKE